MSYQEYVERKQATQQREIVIDTSKNKTPFFPNPIQQVIGIDDKY